MADVINLRMARKARLRADAARQAEQNRALHGQDKAEQQVQKLDAARATRLLDGAKREQD